MSSQHLEEPVETIRLTLTEAELRQVIRRCCSPRGESEDLNTLLAAIGKLCAALERANRKRAEPQLLRHLTHEGETNEEV